MRGQQVPENFDECFLLLLCPRTAEQKTTIRSDLDDGSTSADNTYEGITTSRYRTGSVICIWDVFCHGESGASVK